MKVFIFGVWVLFILWGCRNQAGQETAPTGTNPKAREWEPISKVVGIGKVQPENDIIQLSSAVNGIVQKILKKENDSVKEGEPVLELEHGIEDARVSQLRSQINTQLAQLKVETAAIGEYRAKSINAATEVQRLERLLARGAETQQAVDDARTGLQSYQSNLSRLEAEVEVDHKKIAENQAALLVAQREREQKIIRSPVSGKILEIGAITGSSIDSKQAFAQISPQGNIIAVCEIDELYADKLAEGQQAYIRSLGSTDTLSTGTVRFTASFLKKKSLFTDQAGEKEDRRVREVKILLDDPRRLLLNARVECVIDISQHINK
jgi:multidrug resistance efflux pump